MNKALELPALLVPSGEELAQLEQATATASEVTQNMLLQKMELEEKKRSVAMLQKALVHKQLPCYRKLWYINSCHATESSGT